MQEFPYHIFHFLNINYAVRYLAALLLFSRNLPRRSWFLARSLGWSALCMAAAWLLPIFSDAVPYISTLFLTVFIMSMMVVRISFKADWQTVFYIGAAALSAEHIASMVDSLFSMLQPEQLDYSNTFSLNAMMLLNWTLSAAAVYFVVYWSMFRGRHINRENGLNPRFMFLVLLISLAINLYMNQLFTSLVEERSLWVSIFVYGLNILCSVLLLLVQVGILRQSQTEKRLEVVSILWDQAREQYEFSRETINAINMKCHDLKHLLLAVKGVIDPKEYESMMETINSYGAEIKTNNEVLDVVFQEKNFQCRKLGIQFTCIIDGPAVAFMETTDLYVLFGNLLDNCIEAVSKLPEGEVKNIQVTVRRDRGFVLVTTENGYTGELRWEGGHPGTSKADRQNHGYGLLSIEKIVHKYGGRYSISTEDRIFSMNIVFPVNQK